MTARALGTDRYGRTIADIFQAGRWVNLKLVRDGYAWRYVRYSSDDWLIGAEAAARKAKRGLWGDPAPVAPWEWRRK